VAKQVDAEAELDVAPRVEEQHPRQRAHDHHASAQDISSSAIELAGRQPLTGRSEGVEGLADQRRDAHHRVVGGEQHHQPERVLRQLRRT
jgi:hypothetical protein